MAINLLKGEDEQGINFLGMDSNERDTTEEEGEVYVYFAQRANPPVPSSKWKPFNKMLKKQKIQPTLLSKFHKYSTKQ